MVRNLSFCFHENCCRAFLTVTECFKSDSPDSCFSIFHHFPKVPFKLSVSTLLYFFDSYCKLFSFLENQWIHFCHFLIKSRKWKFLLQFRRVSLCSGERSVYQSRNSNNLYNIDTLKAHPTAWLFQV